MTTATLAVDKNSCNGNNQEETATAVVGMTKAAVAANDNADNDCEGVGDETTTKITINIHSPGDVGHGK
jgi:hypothetical protein